MALEKLEASRAKLSAYEREHGIIASDERLDVENNRLAELSSQLVALQALSAESGSRQGQAARGADQLPDVLSNPVVMQLKSDLSRAEAKLQELGTRYGDNHPQVIEAKASVADVRSKLRTEIVIDDARHFLATSRERFDVITADPIHPWVRGLAALYTQEFYELCRERLQPDGVITQWVPLYESNAPAVKCELATLLMVFPQTLVFNGESASRGDLHFHVDCGRSNVERAAENIGEAENVVDLVRIVGTPGCHDGVVAYRGNFLDCDFRVRIGHREDDRL